MVDFRLALRARAFAEGDGASYNRATTELRATRATPPFVYEVVLTPTRDWIYLRDQVIPRLVVFLHHTRREPTRGDGVVVALFDGPRYTLLECAELFALYGELEGIDSPAFRARVVDWVAQAPS